jgi:hypothetical protein
MMNPWVAALLVAAIVQANLLIIDRALVKYIAVITSPEITALSVHDPVEAMRQLYAVSRLARFSFVWYQVAHWYYLPFYALYVLWRRHGARGDR